MDRAAPGGNPARTGLAPAADAVMADRRTTWYWAALLAVAAGVAVYAYERDLYGKVLDYRASGAVVSELQEEHRRLEAEDQALRRSVDHLRSDDVEIQAAIRRSKNLVRENERIYRIELPPEEVVPPNR